ncbi:hypothetical protein Tco_0365319 [Tanacetum coccineum]
MYWSSSLNLKLRGNGVECNTNMSLHVPQEGSKLEVVKELLEEDMLSMEDEKVHLVNGVFEDALGALGDESFRNGGSSGCHGGLWWLIENEEDDEMVVKIAEASRFDVRREVHHFVKKKWECLIVGNREIHSYDGRKLMRQSDWLFHDHFKVDRSRKVGMIWSFSFLGVCKRTKIPFVCEYGLAIEWNYEDLTKLLEGKSDEFILNHEGDKNDGRVIFLKSDLTIKV